MVLYSVASACVQPALWVRGPSGRKSIMRCGLVASPAEAQEEPPGRREEIYVARLPVCGARQTPAATVGPTARPVQRWHAQ